MNIFGGNFIVLTEAQDKLFGDEFRNAGIRVVISELLQETVHSTKGAEGEYCNAHSSDNGSRIY